MPLRLATFYYRGAPAVAGHATVAAPGCPTGCVVAAGVVTATRGRGSGPPSPGRRDRPPVDGTAPDRPPAGTAGPTARPPRAGTLTARQPARSRRRCRRTSRGRTPLGSRCRPHRTG